ncbi:unnamed protein product [Porites lobata]|uniref:Uncharacterized protein n=1 Tax=Porites lobata TaxID=104759 RepID=A0ABN8N2L6_9CNID|nr:unnamed protein product [Porites lobata]
MLVLGLKDPFSKERLMEREQSLEKTLQAIGIAETSKQHMKSINEEGSKVEKVDVVDGKGQKPQWGMPCRSCGIRHARDSCPAAGRRCHKCQKMNHFSRMCLEDVTSDHQLARFAEATKEDAILSDLQQVILSGWPDSKGQVPPNAQEFWNYRDELTVAQGRIVKGQKIVVPSSLRGEMLEKLREGHLGINKTIARAWELKERQRKQKLQHDRKAKELPPLRDGEVVRVREGDKWKPARVTQVLPSPRSYKVERERGDYRRNRQHLLRTEEYQMPELTPTLEISNDEDLTDTEVEPSSSC